MRVTNFLPAAFLVLLAAAAAAGDRPKKIKYVPPEGFAGHVWGDLRSSFDRLPDQPLGIGAAWMTPLVTQEITCYPLCNDPNKALQAMWEHYQGGGFYVLSEYSIDGQGFQYGTDDSVKFYPVIYQFCANWDSTKKVPPKNFGLINKFCGIKLRFQSETRAQLADLPIEHVTNYDKVLERLVARFGKPDSYLRRGTVVIETMEGESTNAADRKFRVYRWCPAHDRGFHTDCAASVVLSLDPATGAGTVLYSTPLLWEFAYARNINGYKGDPLFKMLHARR